VVADWVFTTTAIVVQPVTGLWLAHVAGFPLSSAWILWSIVLYLVAGACWLPVVWLQLRMREMARVAMESGAALPARYDRYLRIWVALGIPAFAARGGRVLPHGRQARYNSNTRLKSFPAAEFPHEDPGTVKRVVDFNVKVRVKADQSGVELANVKMSMNPFDEIAVEEALKLKEAGKATEVIVASCGVTACQETLRTALAMGADRAILVETDVELQPLAVAKLLKALVARNRPGS
jgi:hypothetical protein